LAKITNISGRRFKSNTLSLLPEQSESVTATHALCYVGVTGLNVEFESSDDLSEVSDARLDSVKRVLHLDADTDAIAHLKPAKRALSLPRKGRKKSKSEDSKPPKSEDSE